MCGCNTVQSTMSNGGDWAHRSKSWQFICTTAVIICFRTSILFYNFHLNDYMILGKIKIKFVETHEQPKMFHKVSILNFIIRNPRRDWLTKLVVKMRDIFTVYWSLWLAAIKPGSNVRLCIFVYILICVKYVGDWIFCFVLYSLCEGSRARCQLQGM